MKILMLVNWKIKYCDKAPVDKQPPDYYIKNRPYWFYRYFHEQPDVDLIDIRSFPLLEHFEHRVIRFYIWQALKAIPRLNQYDLVVSHGMQSGVVVSLWRRLFKTKAKHIVFDIGSFNSAAETGIALRLMQFASKSIDGVIYHTSNQVSYYKKCFPWIIARSQFIPFGTDLELFDSARQTKSKNTEPYILCVGAAKRDWSTLVRAYRLLHSDVKLRIIGHVDEAFTGVDGVEQIPYLPIHELIRHIYNARFCVLPLEAFNYSYGQMTLMQQMALGKCVVAARVPSVTDYVQDGETAVLYEPRNVHDLKEKMKSVLDNPDRAQAIAENGGKYLHENCNEKIMAVQIEQFFRLIYGR